MLLLLLLPSSCAVAVSVVSPRRGRAYGAVPPRSLGPQIADALQRLSPCGPPSGCCRCCCCCCRCCCCFRLSMLLLLRIAAVELVLIGWHDCVPHLPVPCCSCCCCSPVRAPTCLTAQHLQQAPPAQQQQAAMQPQPQQQRQQRQRWRRLCKRALEFVCSVRPSTRGGGPAASSSYRIARHRPRPHTCNAPVSRCEALTPRRQPMTRIRKPARHIYLK